MKNYRHFLKFYSISGLSRGLIAQCKLKYYKNLLEAPHSALKIII